MRVDLRLSPRFFTTLLEAMAKAGGELDTAGLGCRDAGKIAGLTAASPASIIVLVAGGSSSGRTTGSGPVGEGSNPSPPANQTSKEFGVMSYIEF